jgi:cell division initiation protein
MKIAPIDIAHKVFQRKLMGLDPAEVMEFLRAVGGEMENLLRERNDLKETLRDKEMQIIEYRERDELLKSTITTATKMSDKIQSDAEREAKLIINDAQQNAELITRDARDSLKKIYEEISDLKRLRLQFENNLKALVQSHLTMLEQGQKLMPSPTLDVRQERERVAEEADSIRARVTEAVKRATLDN